MLWVDGGGGWYRAPGNLILHFSVVGFGLGRHRSICFLYSFMKKIIFVCYLKILWIHGASPEFFGPYTVLSRGCKTWKVIG